MAEMCIEYFQRFRRQTYVTPKSYLSFIAGYKTIYSEKKGEIGILAERMNTGRLLIHRTTCRFYFPLYIFCVMISFLLCTRIISSRILKDFRDKDVLVCVYCIRYVEDQ